MTVDFVNKQIPNNQQIKPFSIYLIQQVVRKSYVDHTQFDSKDPHYDRWVFEHDIV